MVKSLLLYLIIILTFTTPVLAYAAWTGPAFNSIVQLDEVIRDLEDSIQRATQNSAAYPGFLRDLEGYLARLKQYRDSLDVIDAVDGWGEPELIFDLDFVFNYYDRTFGGVTDKNDLYRVNFGDPLGIGVRDGVQALVFPRQNHPGANLSVNMSKFSELTIDMWVYLDDFGPVKDRGYARLIVDDDTGADFYMMLHNKGPDHHDNSVVVGLGNLTVGTPANSIHRNTWHHIALAHDGERPYVIIDGACRDLTVYYRESLELQLPASGYILGNDTRDERRFAGAIEQLRITDRRRTLSEIQADIVDLLAERPGPTILENETIAGQRINYSAHEAVIYNWRYTGANQDAIRNYTVGAGHLAGYLTVFGKVEKVVVRRAETAISPRIISAVHDTPTKNAMFEIRFNPNDGNRVLIVDLTVRKANGELETVTISTLATAYRNTMGVGPTFVD